MGFGAIFFGTNHLVVFFQLILESERYSATKNMFIKNILKREDATLPWLFAQQASGRPPQPTSLRVLQLMDFQHGSST